MLLQSELSLSIFLSSRFCTRVAELDTEEKKIVGLKLFWIVVSFAWYGCLQNFRPLGSLFQVEVEFVWWWGGVGGV